MGEEFRDRTFKLTEQATGRLLVLRSDITPQIARVAATLLHDYPKPLRFCYNSNVFRYLEPQVGRHREVYQAGVELIGLDLPEADVEMIAIAVESLMEVGLADFKIAVSQVEFLRGLLEQLQLTQRGRTAGAGRLTSQGQLSARPVDGRHVRLERSALRHALDLAQPLRW